MQTKYKKILIAVDNSVYSMKHGRSGFGRILTGSLAEYTIRHATIPVLVISPRM